MDTTKLESIARQDRRSVIAVVGGRTVATAAQDEQETIVIFRAYRDTGEVIALFPEHDEGHGCVSSYLHVGQHGSADYAGTIAATRPATEAEYEDLATELESLGYRLRFLKKKPISL